MLIDLVTFIVKHLVEYPDSVTVSESNLDGKSVIEIRVSSQDMARVIGKEGRIFKSLRSLVNAVSSEGQKHLVVESL